MSKQFTLIAPAYSGQGVRVDRNNCAVRALANVTGRDYNELHQAMKKHGRTDGKGTPWGVCTKVYEACGLRVVGVFGSTKMATSLKFHHFKTAEQHKGMTLARFIKENPTGRFVVGIRGHNTTVINGKLVDSFAVKGSASVIAVWKYE